MKIFLDFQNEYFRRRSLYRDLSAFPLKGVFIDSLTRNFTIFTAIFDVNNCPQDFIYTFSKKDYSQLNFKDFNFTRTTYEFYLADRNGQNVLNLTDDEISFIQDVISQNDIPSLVNTDKDWLKAAYVLWKLDKNKDITIDELQTPCETNFCKVIKLILSLEYIKKTCT